MRIIVADLESFYDPKNLRGDRKPDGSPDPYSIRAMNTESYCRDKRFEMHGIAIKWDARTLPQWYDEREFRYLAKETDWSDIFMVNHHGQFDGLCLSHHYNVHPAMYGCTLSMARLLLGNHISVSLDSVRKQFGLPEKITPYSLFEGRHWNELTPQVQRQVAEGTIDEVNSIWTLFGILAKDLPPEEFEVVDSTIKMFVQPELIGDSAVFAKVWKEEATRKQAMLDKLNLTAKDLGSDDTFATLLRARGIEPDTKVTEKGNTKFAFAKTDPFMEECLSDEDPEVRALAEARLGTKSSLLQTRAATMGWMASRGPLCVYLHYCGAHTSRWSGGDDTNFQNWTNGSDINSAIVAPDGWLIGEPDCSQIECRLLNFCAGQWDKIEEFRTGADPYVAVASAFYKKPINRKDHPLERQLGKIVELQAGYGSGGNKIRSTVRVKSLGKIILTPAEGVQARDAYRSTHPAICADGGYWKQAEHCIVRMANFESYDWGPLRIRCDAVAGKRRVVLPNGIQIVYDTLEFFSDPDDGDRYWRLKTRKGWVKLYGAKLVENLIQALARIVVSQAMIRLKKLGYRCKNTKHDSLWLLIPKDDRVEEHKSVIMREMSRELTWLPGCPLAAEFKGEPAERITW
jgi:hypothetical protein